MADWFKPEYNRLEFRKGALALLPLDDDDHKGTAFSVLPVKNSLSYEYCTCHDGGKGNCLHRTELARCLRLITDAGKKNLGAAFRMSVWDMLAGIFNEALRLPRDHVHVTEPMDDSGCQCLHFSHGDVVVATYVGRPEHAVVLLDRLGLTPDKPGTSSRKDVLDKLDLLSLSDTERKMLAKGIKTRRQVLEESFWFTFCYHLFFDWQFDDGALRAGVDEHTGEFFIENRPVDQRPHFKMIVPRNSVAHVLLGLRSSLDNSKDFAVSDIPLKSTLKMSLTKKKDVRMELWLRFAGNGGDEHLYSRQKLLLFTYLDLVYLKDQACFARIEKPDLLFEKFKGTYSRTIHKDKVPHYMDSLGDAFWGRKHDHIVDDTLKDLHIYKQHDHVAINSEALDRNWFFLSVGYGFGSSRISLADIVKAKKEGRRFIPVEKGWVDCRSVDTDAYGSIPGLDLRKQLLEDTSSLKVSTSDLFRIMAATGKPLDISGKEKEKLGQLLTMKPFDPVTDIPGLLSKLRDYQLKGVHWLMFLHEQAMSGILCDDMGLGKTHQVMALMVWLKQIRKEKKPFLVVAPVTVLSHWETKLNQYAPVLKTLTHHGTERDATALKGHDVIITSFGVLRRDSFSSIKKGFSLAVFDEAQYVKNPRTQVYKAAQTIRADMKLCVTGTPMENSLSDLKALMDLSFPGYLGSDEAFESRYVKPVMLDNNTDRRAELSRLVTPFTLRRMKTSVLHELPEKIEDLRTCRLSDDQTRLYRQAVTDKGDNVRMMMQQSDAIPYMHIFAILTLLKQICDHPALALKTPENVADYESGKWDLFTEILDEALESGQKIVVYSQYVTMIRIIEDHLKRKGIISVSLTGASRKRGDLIRRFNEEPDCRVFVGSLLAGGTGIDLVAASVVIHYDRWWNAAKEDQATDRVHRIGQKRGVQVFKLVTLGTLEEKISAIIEKKKNLMDSVVREDDPNLLKAFTRDQIIDLLSLPDETSWGPSIQPINPAKK
ncbi:MAG: DEAD/DEAH box helicase [Proteobacteria bacterium]|nr:DEAD/DEAH box helicase [Pseudomonadota bacterium]